MRALTKGVVVLSSLLFLPAAAFAQASMSGTVKDASGGVLPGVTIEAASDVLIEKVRTATTDGNGRFQLVDLRPGKYKVTFQLTGFGTVKRDGVELSGTGNTVVDVDLRVGAVAETITVTAESPLVDVSSTRKESVLDHDIVQSLPSSRQYYTLARMVPGTTGGGTDVGGSGNAGASGIADVGQSLTVHGSKNVDQRIMLNGVSIMTLQAGGNIGGQQPDVGSAAEVAVDTSSLSAEGATGGLRINFIPKDGGNTFGNSTFFTFANQSMQGNNYTQALQTAGLLTPTQIDFVYDLNESIGGPIKKDKIWFWFSTRYNKSANYAGIFQNLNAYNPNAWTYAADNSKPAENRGDVYQNNLRLTWQATPKLKIAGEQKIDKWCNCPNNISATVAPEAGRDRRFPRLRQEHVEFASPITPKLLLEGVGMHLFERWGNMDLRGTDNGGSLTDPAQVAAQPNMISVLESSSGLTYRNGAAPCCTSFYNNTVVPNYTYRVAATYVTGTHAFKAGWNDTFGYLNALFYNFNPVGYTFTGGSPTSLTETIVPYPTKQEENHDFGVFVQDNWKLNRLSVTGAIRYDWFKSSFSEQQLGPGSALVGLQTRNITFPAQDNMNWKDISYRSGVVYDVRGDGRTAVRFAANKYLLGQTLNGLGTNPNPILTLQTTTTRTWNDQTYLPGDPRRNNFVPDCDLSNRGINGECQQIQQNSFGSTNAAVLYDPDVLTGWGHRPANWEFSGGFQQQLPRRMSVDVAYFRRIWQNFEVVDNTQVAANEYQAFNMTVPTDTRLPTSGQQLTFYNVIPTRLGAQTLYHSLSDKYGNQYEHWNGLDIVVNGRLNNGLRFQAGLSTGRSSADNCAVVAQLPEMLTFGSVNAAGLGTQQPGNQIAQQFCHEVEPWLTTFKAFESYTVPKIDVQVAATFRSLPGIAGGGNSIASGLAANFVATNAYLGANSNLGRLLTGTTTPTQSVTLQVVDPASVYLDRDNELDLRFGKVLRYRGLRATVNLDLFNALNRSTILTANPAYALTNNVWSAPTLITNPRILKVSVTLDLR
jgi:Carboxypeptidase regulatory-like domain